MKGTTTPFLYQSFFFKTFLILQFGFVIFWQNNIRAKAGHKMLVKLVPVVN